MTQRQLRAYNIDEDCAQEFLPTRISNTDNSSYDLRIFTHGHKPMVCVTRHFFGSKMNMSDPGSGIRRIHLVEKLEEGWISHPARVVVT